MMAMCVRVGIEVLSYFHGNRRTLKDCYVFVRPVSCFRESGREEYKVFVYFALLLTWDLRLPNQPPTPLTVLDWSQIRAEYERSRHTAFPNPSGDTSRNDAQQWNAHYDGSGFEIRPDHGRWTWGLALTGHGTRAAKRVLKNRVQYLWGDGVEEWFVNDALGVEHGFTLQRPVGDLRLRVRGGLRARPDGISALTFMDAKGQVQLHYKELKVWDANRKPLPAWIEGRDDIVTIHVEDRDAVYPVTVDPIVQHAYLKARSPKSLEQFGHSVAIFGDTVVIGAIGDANSNTGVDSSPFGNAPRAGAAYVFVMATPL